MWSMDLFFASSSHGSGLKTAVGFGRVRRRQAPTIPSESRLIDATRLRHNHGPKGHMIDDLWYKNAVFYCLSVGSFMDADGDGCGDFKGLTRRLDYIHGLGITAIWLMPFQPCLLYTSPSPRD